MSPSTVNASAAPGRRTATTRPAGRWSCVWAQYIVVPQLDLRRVAEPEELEPRVDEQRDVEDEHERRGDPADHVRHQLREDDPSRRLPATFAASTKSRFFSDSAWLRRIRASNAQSIEGEDDDHHAHAALVEVAGDDDQQRDRGDDEEDVRQEVDELVEEAARRTRR